MSDEQRPAELPPPEHRRPSIGEGIRAGVGVLTALKEAIEETIQETVDRGDLKPERAKEFLSGALHRAQDAVGDVRERLDFVPRKELDDLRTELAELRRRVDALEGHAPAALPPPPTVPSGGEGPAEQRIP